MKKIVIDTSSDTVSFNGKKIIFIGDSNIYWSRVVEARAKEAYTQEKRENDRGIFYQLCKANGVEVSVTNWTFGSHGIRSFFGGECTVKGGCKGVNHEAMLVDRNYDYVFIGLTRGETDEKNMIEYFEYIISLFKEANPNVKVVALAPTTIYGLNDTGVVRNGTIGNLKTLEERYGVIIADWGSIVKDLINGASIISSSEHNCNRNTFIVTKDNKHPNLLAGYITALTAYCVVTGESAVGQPYKFMFDESLKPIIDISQFTDMYYNNGKEETNYYEILNSPRDMMGIQQLVDSYIETKPYLSY